MYIKAQTQIPPEVKIKRYPPKAAAGKSFWAVLRMQERAVEKKMAMEAKAIRFTKLVKAGCTVEEAIKIISM